MARYQGGRADYIGIPRLERVRCFQLGEHIRRCSILERQIGSMGRGDGFRLYQCYQDETVVMLDGYLKLMSVHQLTLLKNMPMMERHDKASRRRLRRWEIFDLRKLNSARSLLIAQISF